VIGMSNEVTLRKLLNAPQALVFKAWTDPQLMTRWFFPGENWTVSVKSDLRVGGRYELLMRDSEGTLHEQFGEFREIVPVSRLVFTWSCPDLAVVDSVVTIDLAAQGERTELLLVHELPPDPKIRRGHEEGWKGCLGNLEKWISGREIQ
jgi:uncharacterized protein YndB with AHSA1/START domain